MDQNPREYIAFISYKREEEAWAKWLQRKLEHYRFPPHVRKANPHLPKEVRPVFRDTTELASGVLEEEINKCLRQSKFLIVLCSPRAAQSPWVAKEIRTFIDLGRERNIIPFIIDGTAHSKGPARECFPPPLLDLPAEKELIGIADNEYGRDGAVIKVIARIFDLPFDTLWQRYRRARRRRRILWGAFFLALAISGLAVGAVITRQNAELRLANENLERANKEIRIERDRANQERDHAEAVSASLRIANDSILKQRGIILQTNENLRQANWSMLKNQSRAAAEKGMKLIDDGDSYTAIRLALEILPRDLSNPDRPFVPEAEALLRKAFNEDNAIIRSPAAMASISPDGRILASCYSERTSGDVTIWDVLSGRQIKKLPVGQYENPDDPVLPHLSEVGPDGRTLFVSSELGGVPSSLWDIGTGQLIKPLHHDGPNEMTIAAAFSHDGKTVCEAKKDALYLWDVASGSLISSIPLGKDEAKTLRHHAARQEFIVLALREGRLVLRRFDQGTGADRGELVLDHAVVRQFFWAVIGNGTALACQVKADDGTQIWVWDIEKGELVFKDATAYAYSACFSPDETSLYAIGTTDDSSCLLYEWSVPDGTRKKDREFKDSHYLFIQMSPAGDRLALCGENIRLLSLGSHEKVESIHGGHAFVSPVGDVFATNSNGDILVYDVHSRKLIRKYRSGSLSRPAITPDGKYIVQSIRLSGDVRPEFLVIDMKKGTSTETNTIPGYTKLEPWDQVPVDHVFFLKPSLAKKMMKSWYDQSYDPVCFSFSPDRDCIAVRLRQVTNHEDGFMQIWDCVKEEPMTPVIRSFSEEFGTICYTPDGEYIVTDSPVKIWNPFTGHVIKEFPDLTGGCMVSPDGGYLFLRNYSKVQIAEIASGGIVYEFDGARTIAPFPDGRSFIMSSNEQTWIVASPSLSELLGRMRARFEKVPLSQAERNRYFLGTN